MKNFLVILLIIGIGFGIGWFIVRPKTTPQLGVSPKTTPVVGQIQEKDMYNPAEIPVTGSQIQGGETKGGINSPSGIITQTTITYKDDGFHESVVYIKLGSSVIFKNESSREMWVASAPHPAHTTYPEFDQKKSVLRGGTYAFVFTKVGSWKFHNHMMPDQTGTIVVRQ